MIDNKQKHHVLMNQVLLIFELGEFVFRDVCICNSILLYF